MDQGLALGLYDAAGPFTVGTHWRALAAVSVTGVRLAWDDADDEIVVKLYGWDPVAEASELLASADHTTTAGDNEVLFDSAVAVAAYDEIVCAVYASHGYRVEGVPLAQPGLAGTKWALLTPAAYNSADAFPATIPGGGRTYPIEPIT